MLSLNVWKINIFKIIDTLVFHFTLVIHIFYPLNLKGEACQAFYLFVRNEFIKFNETKARISDSVDHMALRLL